MGSVGVGALYVFRGLGRSAPMRGTAPAPLAPPSVVATGLAVGFSLIVLGLWRTRVIIDHLGLTRRGFWGTRRFPSESIQRIGVIANRAGKCCVVQTRSGSVWLSLSLRSRRTREPLVQVLARMMPDKVTQELRELARQSTDATNRS